MPVGVPSLITEESVLNNLENLKNPNGKKLFIFKETSYTKEVMRYLSPEIQICLNAEDADICWLPPNTDKSWGRFILESYELGIPCVSSQNSSVAKILFDGTNLISDEDNAEKTAEIIIENIGNKSAIKDGIPFFRRCFGEFYWTNSFIAYFMKLYFLNQER